MGYCCEKGITISFFNPNGRFQARVEGPVSGNVLLRREQYRVSDDPVRCAAIVRSILAGKIHALLDERFHVARADIDKAAAAALRHRIILNFEGEAEGTTSDDVISEILRLRG